MEEFAAFTIASAVSYLVEGQELYEASLLLLCTNLDFSYGNVFHSGSRQISDLGVELYGNRSIYEILNDEKHRSTVAIFRAIQAALGPSYNLTSLKARAVISDAMFESDWRSKLLDVIEGKIPLNQGVPIQDKPRYTWEYLFFRAPVEIAIAKSLDKHPVLFLPNCAGRLGIMVPGNWTGK